MDKLPNIMELDDPDPESPDQPSTSHDTEDSTTSQNASQERSSSGTSQASDLGRDLDLMMEKTPKFTDALAGAASFNPNQGFDNSFQKGNKKRKLDDSSSEEDTYSTSTNGRKCLGCSKIFSSQFIPDDSVPESNFFRTLDSVSEDSRKLGYAIRNILLLDPNRDDSVPESNVFRTPDSVSEDARKLGYAIRNILHFDPNREDSTTSQNASQERSSPGTSQASDNDFRGLDLLWKKSFELGVAQADAASFNLNREDPTTSQSASQERSSPWTSQASYLVRDLGLVMEEAKKVALADAASFDPNQGFKQPQTVEELKRHKDETEKRKQQLEMMMRQQSQEIKQIKKENKELRQKIKESQSSSQATSSGLRIINQQPPGGRMSVERSHESLPGYISVTLAITYSFPAGSLNGVSYEAMEFTEYVPDVGFHILKRFLNLTDLLRKAFNAGLLFKIQIIERNRGEIIWNDEIPHKTNKHGCAANNGYPDQDHIFKLRDALKAKLKAEGIKF
uniref:uncharacterized protein LOC120340030 n=1 Tax=Styela clava TaxID=7725 RepID=UPI00193A2EF7|nr:uncharacterized protein LOC120340030 [Styela clava]